jgi:hypothetical protein
MRVIRLLAVALLLLILVELSFRVWLYGFASLIPSRMNSFTQIHDSGLVHKAAIPGVQFELRPNIDSWYKGVPFKTNSKGLRGPEVSLDKASGVKRIAVLGASWTMGSGVRAEEIWHVRLQQQLIESDPASRYEVINFGVDQYGLGELVATLENKVVAYKPDVVLLALTFYTPTIRWDDPPAGYVELDRRYPLFDLHSLRLVDMRLGLNWFDDLGSRRPEVADINVLKAQLAKAVDRMDSFVRETGIPLVVLKLSYQPSWSRKAAVIGPALDRSTANVPLIDVTENVSAYGYKPADLRISVWDSHPNPLAHGIIAEIVHAELQSRQLLP